MNMNFYNKSKIGYLGLAFFGVVILFFIFNLNPSFVLDAGERAILFNNVTGLQKKIYGPGLNFKLPGLERVIKYYVKQQAYEFKTTASSKDLQDVGITLRILYNPDPNKLPEIKEQFGEEGEYQDKLFLSFSKEVLKSVIAKRTAEELITQRETVSKEIREALTEKMKTSFIQIYDVAIADIEFSKEYASAIEQKQVAQQKFEASKKEAQAAIEKARGESESARLINEASKVSPAFIELRKIEAQKEIAKTLAGSSNVIYLPSNTVLMMQPEKK